MIHYSYFSTQFNKSHLCLLLSFRTYVYSLHTLTNEFISVLLFVRMKIKILTWWNVYTIRFSFFHYLYLSDFYNFYTVFSLPISGTPLLFTNLFSSTPFFHKRVYLQCPFKILFLFSITSTEDHHLWMRYFVFNYMTFNFRSGPSQNTRVTCLLFIPNSSNQVLILFEMWRKRIM